MAARTTYETPKPTHEAKWDDYMHWLERLFDADVMKGFHASVKALMVALRRGNMDAADDLITKLSAPMADDATLQQRTAHHALFMFHVSPCAVTRSACEKMLEFIPQNMRVLEVNAHRGVWGRYLQLLGRTVDMVHRDVKSYSQNIGEVRATESPVSFMEGARGRYGALLLVGADYQKNMGDAIACVERFDGDVVFYVGIEPKRDNGPSPADAWDVLERDWKIVEFHELPMWPYRADHVMIYKRK